MKPTPLIIPLLPMLLLLATDIARGQETDGPGTEKIALRARPARDSITLRWAPTDFETWRTANLHGYRIERQVIVRNGRLVREVEKTVLHPALVPLPESDWETIAAADRYGAIAAQALWGERFELDLSQSDVFTIVNKVRENDQRFSFALFCADLSPRVARASGLWFADKNIRADEKYLYRIYINHSAIAPGSIFAGPLDAYTIPKPDGLEASYQEYLVSLRWRRNKTSPFTAFRLTRSDDGITFNPVSDTPLVTMAPDAHGDPLYDFAIDSLQDPLKEYCYRVTGITPFGEQSLPSDIVCVKAPPSVSQVPYIDMIDSRDNRSLEIRWQFPEHENGAITGFSLARASSPGETFSEITHALLAPAVRAYADPNPDLTNYYRVTAHGVNGRVYTSPAHYAQLVDSIPPAPPAQVIGRINDTGIVHLSWAPGVDGDLYGYRVYRANYASEEMAQLTVSPVTTFEFYDTLDLHTLNEKVFYSVMAVDRSQNHSALSDKLEVVLPDQVPPVAPVMLPLSSDGSGVSVAWIPSSSTDVTYHEVFRKAPGEDQWLRIANISMSGDSTGRYTDTAAPGPCLYTVVAIDDAGLESEPAHPVRGMITRNSLRAAITWKKPVLKKTENSVVISWHLPQDPVASFRIFRSVAGEPPVLAHALPGDRNEWRDNLVPGTHYSYQIMALYADGGKTVFSEQLDIEY